MYKLVLRLKIVEKLQVTRQIVHCEWVNSTPQEVFKDDNMTKHIAIYLFTCATK